MQLKRVDFRRKILLIFTNIRSQSRKTLAARAFRHFAKGVSRGGFVAATKFFLLCAVKRRAAPFTRVLQQKKRAGARLTICGYDNIMFFAEATYRIRATSAENALSKPGFAVIIIIPRGFIRSRAGRLSRNGRKRPFSPLPRRARADRGRRYNLSFRAGNPKGT